MARGRRRVESWRRREMDDAPSSDLLPRRHVRLVHDEDTASRFFIPWDAFTATVAAIERADARAEEGRKLTRGPGDPTLRRALEAYKESRESETENNE